MARRLLALATVLLAGCGAPGIGDQPVAVDPPYGASEAAPPATPAPTPDATPGGDGVVHADAVWFEVLAISTEAADHGSIAVATDPAELDAQWARHRFDGAPPTVDLDQHVVVVYARAEDACPDDLVELRLSDGVLEATWLPPPGACPQPLIATAYAVAVHRADLPESFTVALRQHEGHGGDVTADVTLPPYDGPPAPKPSPPPRQMSDEELDAAFDGHPLVRCDELPESSGSAEPSEHDEVQRELHERFADPHQRPRVTWSGTGKAGRLVIGVVDPTREDLDAIAEVVDPDRACIEPERSGLAADREG